MRKIKDQTADVLPEKAEKGSKTNVNRASRNKSEKDRRDKVNAFINELAGILPDCSPQSKKLDKATILKNTVDFMKIHNDLTVAITRKDMTSCLSSNEVGQLMFEGDRAFLFVVSLSGMFTFLSKSVYDLLGYKKEELVKKNVFDYICPEDDLTLKKQISQDNRTGIARNSGTSLFYIRFKAKVDGKPFYETLRCCGNFRTGKEEVKTGNDGDNIFNSTCFVVLAKLVQPSYQREVSEWLTVDVEFTSRQSLDGKLLYLDPRCIPITGYLPYEILGSMIYEYIHFDDLEKVTMSFEALLDDGEGETEDYRILTKGCQWIVIKTSSYISYNHWNCKPEFICSTHQLVRNPVKCKFSRSSSVQMDEMSNAIESEQSSMWKIESDNSQQSGMSSDLNTSSTFLRNSQTEDIVTNVKVNSTAINGLQAANTHVSPYVTTQIVNSLEIKTASENNRHLPSPVTYWSGQTPDVRFQNPLATQFQQQNTERLQFSIDTSTNVRTDRYPQPARVFQGPPAPNNTNMWQNSPPPQRFTDNSVDTPQPNFQMPQGYYASSPVTPERTFQAPRRSLSSLSHSSSSLPPSSPASDIYPPSPTNTRVTSPHVTVETRHQQSPSPGYHTNSYPQSPPRVSHSTQIRNSDGYISSSSPVSPSPRRRVMQGYSTQYPTQSPQVLDRYAQTPVFTADPSSPYTSPQTPDRSSQSPPQYPPLSPSLAPVYHQTPARAHHIPTGTNELCPTMSSYSPTSPNDVRSFSGGYSLPLQSITSYSQSPYEYPKSSPQTPTNATERYLQSNIPPHTMPQDSLDYCRSPERYSQRSPALPPVRRNELNEQSVTRSSQPGPVVHNNTRFSVQPDQQHVTNLDRQTQYKKSAEDSLQPCQVKNDIDPRSPSTTSRLPREMLNRNFQSPLQFGSNLEARAPDSEMIPLSRTNNGIPQDDLSKTNVNCESQILDDVANKQCLGGEEEQAYQQTQEQTFVTTPQNFSNDSMHPTKSTVHAKAQKILHSQLLEKQNHLQTVIQYQKVQLTRIQEQIILNAQAQFSLHDVGNLESTKELQQQVYDLETERRQHETRQRELRSMFQQKLDGLPAYKNDGEIHSSVTIQQVSSPGIGIFHNIGNKENYPERNSPTLSEANINVSRSTAQKSRREGLVNGSYEFANQDALPTSSSQGFGEDSFDNDQTCVKGKSYGHYTPVLQSYKTSPVSSQKNNDLSFSEHPNIPSNTTGGCAGLSGNQTKDYFSKFSSNELEVFLSSSCSFPSTASTSSDCTSDDVGKDDVTAPSTYDSLLRQQKRLLEMQEEQRRQLVRRQQQQFLRLQQQQQRQQRMLSDLQQLSENTQQEQNDQREIASAGSVTVGDPISLSPELSDEDLNVVNMLLSEEVGTEFWTDVLFDKTSSGS